jgi:hypothetical protein
VKKPGYVDGQRVYKIWQDIVDNQMTEKAAEFGIYTRVEDLNPLSRNNAALRVERNGGSTSQQA